MQQIPFVKFSPTQNVTVLVTQPVPRAQQPEIAAKLLAYDGVGGEQVGFLEKPDHPDASARLQMMGGEFCGNATMSLGAYLAWQDGLEDGAERDYLLEVSGAEKPVVCHVVRDGDDYRGTVRMPLPESVSGGSGEEFPAAFPRVSFPGIVHLILRAGELWNRDAVERSIRGWNDAIGADALGALLYDERERRFEPVVYVPATDSVVWERGCGSGTAAIGCWNAVRTGGDICMTLGQPGGEISVSAKMKNGKIVDLAITGRVKITASGIAYL